MSFTRKGITFEFFEKNPHVLHDCDIEKYLKLLGIKESTYIKYRDEYITIVIANMCTMINFTSDKSNEKREKFRFDDSKLFKF